MQSKLCRTRSTEFPTANLHRYNFALCGANKLVTMSIDEDITRSTLKGVSKENMVTVQGRRLGEFLASEISGKAVDLIKMDIHRFEAHG